jgi:putative PIG3 family NAD(P)H quinone oxidoreductase
MRAVVITQPGGPEVLAVREVAAPEPGEREVRIRVHAAGLNRADILQRLGRYPAPAGAPRDIPGLEFAGEVESPGKGATRWPAGARVMGIASGGGYAEFITAHEDMLMEVPPKLDWTAAAAVPEAFITAHDALYTQARLATGERVLIHAVGSGVGLTAVQLVLLAGAMPFGTSRTEDKISRAREFGMQDGVLLDEKLSALPEKAKAWTSGRGFDVVLDLVGGAYTGASVNVMAEKGRMVVLATAGGARAEVDLRAILSKRLHLTGSALRPRSLEEKIMATEAFAEDVLPALASGRVHPVIDSVFPLAEAGPAHRRLESNGSFGKVVLSIA